MMPAFTVSEQISSRCSGFRVGLLLASVAVNERPAALHTYIQELCRELAESDTSESIRNQPVIAATRAAYKKLGKDPSRYRPAAESLMKRVVNGKDLYLVNNVVDSLNAVSLNTGFSIGGYDLSCISGAIEAGIGLEGEDYQGIGRGELNIAGMTVLRDEVGAFGTPTSDSLRTMVRESTTGFLMVFYDYEGSANLEGAFGLSRELLEQHAQGADFHTAIHG